MKRRKSPKAPKLKQARKFLILRLPEEFYFCSKRNRIFKNRKKEEQLKRFKINPNEEED